MNLTQDEVLQILKLLDDSAFDELDLQMGELKLRVRRKGAARVSPDPTTEGEPQTGSPGEGSEAAAMRPPRPLQTEPAPPAPIEEVEAGLIQITAPILGTFFRRPAPNEPPFVEVGTFVKEDDSVCLLEVMKVFNTVKAGVRGRIEKICAESGELVEFRQILFLVRAEQEESVSKPK